MNEANAFVSSEAPKIPVLVVDDHVIWCDGLRTLLEDTEFRVVGEATSGEEAIERAHKTNPHLTLLDIRLMSGDGLDALVALKELYPRMVVIILTTYDNPTFVSRAISGGAAGYLLKGARRQEILSTMRRAVAGEGFLIPENLRHSSRNLSAAILPDYLDHPLTDRELEVLCLIATGLTNRGIGEILFISSGTVKSHIEHILAKIGVSDRVQAVVWAIRHGIVSVSE
jgi:DNA-binding NarL/FixJ family response regulator